MSLSSLHLSLTYIQFYTLSSYVAYHRCLKVDNGTPIAYVKSSVCSVRFVQTGQLTHLPHFNHLIINFSASQSHHPSQDYTLRHGIRLLVASSSSSSSSLPSWIQCAAQHWRMEFKHCDPQHNTVNVQLIILSLKTSVVRSLQLKQGRITVVTVLLVTDDYDTKFLKMNLSD